MFRVYGNRFLLPLIGGSGGSGGSANGGTWNGGSGGGGGGAILIAATNTISVTGSILARGGSGTDDDGFDAPSTPTLPGGGGSGGAIRLMTSVITGDGSLNASGGFRPDFRVDGGFFDGSNRAAGNGRIRIEAIANNFASSPTGVASFGIPGILSLSLDVQPRVSITSIDGNSVPASPFAQFDNPDVVLPDNIPDPVDVVVDCVNLPLNTTVTLHVKPQFGPRTTFTGTNDTGTLESSTATISVNLPGGKGILSAHAVRATLK